jgi:catalase
MTDKSEKPACPVMTTSSGRPVGEEGNWDMVGNNTPVFFVRDALKFGDFIHSQKRVPGTNLRSPTMMWDFWSLSPESLHQVTTLFSDRGTPDGFRHMHGFSSPTYSLINADRERFWMKWHFLTMQGIKNLSAEQAEELAGKDPDYATRDLWEAIERGDYPAASAQRLAVGKIHSCENVSLF